MKKKLIVIAIALGFLLATGNKSREILAAPITSTHELNKVTNVNDNWDNQYPSFNFRILPKTNSYLPDIYSDNAQHRYYLRITNNSRYDIYHIYLSSSESDNWGSDNLGKYILYSGSTHTITNIVPGEYDVKFLDEDNDKCILRNISIFQNTSWSLTSSWLSKCEGY